LEHLFTIVLASRNLHGLWAEEEHMVVARVFIGTAIPVVKRTAAGAGESIGNCLGKVPCPCGDACHDVLLSSGGRKKPVHDPTRYARFGKGFFRRFRDTHKEGDFSGGSDVTSRPPDAACPIL